VPRVSGAAETGNENPPAPPPCIPPPGGPPCEHADAARAAATIPTIAVFIVNGYTCHRRDRPSADVAGHATRPRYVVRRAQLGESCTNGQLHLADCSGGWSVLRTAGGARCRRCRSEDRR